MTIQIKKRKEKLCYLNIILEAAALAAGEGVDPVSGAAELALLILLHHQVVLAGLGGGVEEGGGGGGGW